MGDIFSHPFDVLAAIPQLPDEAYLVLHYTERCNATCAHCIVESGPHRAGVMDPEVARAAIEGASRLPDVRLVVFTGGESFLHLDEILALCRFSGAQGMKTRVISNGYWARTPEAAAAMLERIVDQGVDQLVISFDAFHLPYIAPERVLNVHRGARLAKRAPYLAFSTVIPARADAQELVEVPGGLRFPRAVIETLAAYDFPLEHCVPRTIAHAQLALLDREEARGRFKRAMVHERAMVSWESLALGGRAAREARHLTMMKPLPAAPTPCSIAGSQVTIPSNGRLFPCCSAWTNHTEHAFGAVGKDGDFATLQAQMLDDPLVRFIHDHGPGELLAFLRDKGASAPGRYSDICNMCDALFARFSLDELRNAVRLYHRTRPWAQLIVDVRRSHRD